jgi:hypothetical protein
MRASIITSRNRGLMFPPVVIARADAFTPSLPQLSQMSSIIPSPADQNPWAHWLSPMDMILQG